MPITITNVPSRAKSLQLLVMMPYHGWRELALQDIYNSGKGRLLVSAANGTQGLLGDNRAVESLWRVLTHITIAAIVA